MTARNRWSPFHDVREALDRASDEAGPIPDGGATVRVDPHRQRRTGIPEVVHCGAKPAADVADALRQLAAANGRALATRISPDIVDEIRAILEPEFDVEAHPVARALIAALPGQMPPMAGGVVGIISAGTSDVPIATEASLIAEEMGARVMTAWDVGVAGLHRLIEPLERFAAEQVDVVVVAAGMDGALPAVVAGLVDVPVIGLPTSVGYGIGGGGIGALTTMLQSCAPGLVVVNIDNGIGAGSTAALIANRVAKSRSSGGN
jgi:pyridinium-3,5-biscarboxylic acid mononucleotide synthase